MKIRHILVTTDLSAGAAAAVPHACYLATAFGARISLLTVSESPRLTICQDRAMETFLEQVAQAREQALEQEAQVFSDQRLDVQTVTVAGVPWREIIAFAEREGVDLIVTAKHGAQGVERLLMGSQALRVARHSTIPVLMVHPSGQRREQELNAQVEYHHITLPTDFGVAADIALKPTLQLAEVLDAQVTLTHVLRLPTLVPGRIERPSDELLASLRGGAQATLERALKRTDSNRTWSRLLVGTGIAQSLEDELTRTDLFVIPVRGAGAIARTVLGTTAERLLRLTARPVLLFPNTFLSRFGERPASD